MALALPYKNNRMHLKSQQTTKPTKLKEITFKSFLSSPLLPAPTHTPSPPHHHPPTHFIQVYTSLMSRETHDDTTSAAIA